MSYCAAAIWAAGSGSRTSRIIPAREATDMSHAVVINVNLPGEGTPEEGLKMLNEMVIPQARAQKGFQSGTWMNDHGKGMGVVLFDTEENANAALEHLRP